MSELNDISEAQSGDKVVNKYGVIYIVEHVDDHSIYIDTSPGRCMIRQANTGTT